VSVDVDAAGRFIYANARLLDRHRLAVLRGGDAAPVLATLRAYRNSDGGFGHALEPDVRAPQSEPASTLHALEVLAEVGALGDPMVPDAVAWIASIADPDGGVPMVMPTAAQYPHAPWMAPTTGGSQLTFALAAVLQGAASGPWLERATDWCWAKVTPVDELHAYQVKFALAFFDAVADEARATAAIESLRARIGADGSIAVAGGTADERLTPLALSPKPDARSRVLFTAEQIDADLDVLEHVQQDDGGWTFDFLGWSQGQTVEWRGVVTLLALASLSAHGRIELQK
jgi:hypothetical protein